MKMIRDERLLIQNLKNIRTAFVVQTLGVVAILVHQAVTEGARQVVGNPLWLVLMLTMVVFTALHLGISIDVYDSASKRKKPRPYVRGVAISVLAGVALALLAWFGPDQAEITETIFVGGVVFICSLIPFTIVYFQQKKRSEEEE